ncbi:MULTISPECIES: RNA polymerase sigma factor SigM [unclassified Gordonia (in: high G+C Gram-positive bacteria)]|uniref:RNA polymerase sigma factor SigM n=1 Tax=unclassified Gordonia (in: high G+C Gram-positive bacteria) TaxID=2657482 RepID=UPI001FFF0AF8|nr:RNA polymerase sigma factor SigM [Gordonia sp. PP30]UQE74716.1 RNA polymerase sigma factor SigM [Gordonia sp. PP30]
MTRGIIEEVSDAELLHAGARGDGGAFGELYERHKRYLWSIALRTAQDPDDAEDALQDALVSIVRTAGSFRCDSSVLVWMHRVVVNSCLDRLRRRKCHDGVPLPEFDCAAPHIAPEDFTESIDLQLAIGRALDVLPAGQREAIIAVDLQGRSIEETAALLGVAPGTVKSRCARGRHKLALVLGHLRLDD